jgi:hypothetical protein
MRAQLWPRSPWPGEESVFAIEGDELDGIFDWVGLHLDTTIPILLDVGELVGKAGFGGDTAALLGQPVAEVSNQRGRLFLVGGKALSRCSP